MVKIIGFGALNVDKIYQVENLLQEENPAHLIDTQAGGSAANTVIGLAKLGISGGFVGVIAQDAYGKLLLTEFKIRNVDTSHIIIRKADDLSTTSGLVDAYVDKKGRRLLFVKPGVNGTLLLKEVSFSYLKKAEFLHLSSFVDEAQFEIQKSIVNMISDDIKISFSPGSLYCAKGLKAIAPILKKSHVVFLDKREIYQLTGSSYKKGVEQLLKLKTKTVVVTLGKTGCFVATIDHQFLAKTRRVKVVDTTGAGDAFSAGFLFGLINDLTLEKSAEIGNAVASFSIQRFGARAGLPNRKELSSVVSLPK